MCKDLELLESLRQIVGCTYISDLRIEPYNTEAKLIFDLLISNKYPQKQIEDAFRYIYRYEQGYEDDACDKYLSS